MEIILLAYLILEGLWLVVPLRTALFAWLPFRWYGWFDSLPVS
jgi:hypothetical protein